MALVLFLTFQSPQGTYELSKNVREWVGFRGNLQKFRSDIHIIEYFVVGFAFTLFGLSVKWKTWISGALGCGFGLFDELLKIMLPTREFSGVDLIKDIIGVWIAVFLVVILHRLNIRCRNDNPSRYIVPDKVCQK